jgi:hypothetical protein
MKPASHPSHTLWKSLRDSHIPTASATGHMSFRTPATRIVRQRKGLVTDVSGPQRNACPGTLSETASGPSNFRLRRRRRNFKPLICSLF